MSNNDEKWQEKFRKFILRRLFILDHVRIRNSMAIMLSDLSELSTTLYFFLNPLWQLKGPIMSLIVKEVFGSNPLSYDSADGLPIVITIINIIILLMILFWMGNTLQNIRLTIICLYLYVVPTLFLDTIFAIINIPKQTGLLLVICSIGLPITLLINLLSLFLHKKLYRLLQIVVILAYKIGNPWVVFVLLCLRLLCEWKYSKQGYLQNLNRFTNIYLLLVYLALILSKSLNSTSNDIVILFGLVISIILAVLYPITEKVQNLQECVKQQSEDKCLEMLEEHAKLCNQADCKCKTLENVKEIKDFIINLIRNEHLSTNDEYFRYAQFCLDSLEGNLKGLNLMTQYVKPANIAQLYRYTTIYIRYEIQSSKNRQNGFKIETKHVRNIQQEISKFKEILRQVVTQLSEFWLDIKFNNGKGNTMGSVRKLSKKIQEIEQNYERIKRNHENNIELEALFRAFRQRIVHKQSYDSQEEVSFPAIPPFMIVRGQKIIKVNQSFCQVFGWNEIQLVGQSIDQILPDVFEEYHEKWMQEYIETYDIHASESKAVFNKGRHRIKPVECRTGLIRVSDFSVQIIPSFQYGIEMISFFQPRDDYSKKSSTNVAHMLVSMATLKIQAFDIGFFKWLKIPLSKSKVQHLQQEISLPQMIPIYQQGQARVREQMQLGCKNGVTITFSMQPIVDLLKLECEVSQKQVNIEYINCFTKSEVKDLRLIKIVTAEQKKTEIKNSTAKANTESVIVKDNAFKLQQEKYRIPYYLVLFPVILYTLHHIIVEKGYAIDSWLTESYKYIGQYMEQCIQAVNGQNDVKSEGLYLLWLKNSIGRPIVLNTLDNLMRSVDGYQIRFRNLIEHTSLSPQFTLIQNRLNQNQAFVQFLWIFGWSFCALTVSLLVSDTVMSIRYIFKTNDSFRKILKIVEYIQINEVNAILIELYALQQALGAHEIPKVQQEELDEDKKPNKFSVESFSVILHALSISQPAPKLKRTQTRGAAADTTPGYLMSRSNLESPDDTMNELKPNLKPEETEKPTKLVISVIVNSTIMLVISIVFIFVIRSMDVSLVDLVEAHNRISQQYPLLQQSLFNTKMKFKLTGNIEEIIHQEQGYISRIAGIAPEISHFWSNMVDNDICSTIHDIRCKSLQGGIYTMGNKVVLSRFASLLKLGDADALASLQKILDFHKLVANQIQKVFKTTIDAFFLRWSDYSKGVLIALLLITLSFFVVQERLLKKQHEKNVEFRRILEIIPNQIMTNLRAKSCF